MINYKKLTAAMAAGIIAIFTKILPGMSMFSFLILTTTVSEFVAAMDSLHIPKSFTVPLLGFKSPVNIFIVVVFPHPFEPKNPNISPWAIIGTLVQGFQTACPSSFSGLKMFDAQINGHPAAAAVLSCGMLNNQSETALIIAIRGVNDYYTVQWAEHGKASSKPLKLDEEKWLARFNALELGLHTATSPNR